MPESVQNNKILEKEQVSLQSIHPRAEASVTTHAHYSPAVSRRSSSPDTHCAVVRAKGLEAVPQSLHVGVFVTLQLEARGDDFGRPSDTGGVVVGLEHQIEVSGMGRVDGEVVRAVPGVGFGVGGEPCLCEEYVLVEGHSVFRDLATYPVPPWTSSGTSRHRTSRRPSSP